MKLRIVLRGGVQYYIQLRDHAADVQRLLIHALPRAPHVVSAYGFQLASKVKRMGKIAVHMGGSLQTLFGIKGVRWNKNEAQLYNDAWVYPSEAETPKGYEKVENGAYWKPTQ